jgi:hypothetical protein
MQTKNLSGDLSLPLISLSLSTSNYISLSPSFSISPSCCLSLSLSLSLSLHQIIIVLLIEQSIFADGCTVIEKVSQKVKPCIFPFTFSGQTLTECTTLKDPEGKLWCSTRVNDEGKHVTSGGFWGFCEQDCDKNQQESLKAELPNLSGEKGFLK